MFLPCVCGVCHHHRVIKLKRRKKNSFFPPFISLPLI
uniref:Uncharacterized protein n=1 Tax=Anguilla anguilla TaxID=7936 RepID=A0A0E9SBF4_ANGAN